MNYRKDIYEKVKFMLKDDTNVNIDCSKHARQYGCDRRTVSKAINAVKNNLPQPKVSKPRKTDGFEMIIEEKLKTGAPAIGICNYLIKHHGYTGSYTTIKDFVRNLNLEKQKQAVIRFETNPGIQAQVDWKESLKFKTQDGDTIKFNVFLLILGFSRTKFLCVTETRDLHTVEECLVKAFKYIGGVPHEILFDNMRSIIDNARTQYNEPVFNDEFSIFSSDCGFTPKACVAYRHETKGKVEVTAKLVNRLKVYSGDITCFDDIRKIAAELNEQINSEKCQATDKPPFELLKFEKPYLIQTDLNILSGYFKETVTRKVSVDSLITYEGRKYSVPPKYIGKYVEIEYDGTGFNITFNGHFIRHWDKTSKLTNFNHHDYMEIAGCSSLKRLSDDEITNCRFNKSTVHRDENKHYLHRLKRSRKNTSCYSHRN